MKVFSCRRRSLAGAIAICLLFVISIGTTWALSPLQEAGGIEGDWKGAIAVLGTQIPMVVTFTKSGDLLRASMDIQGTKGIPLQNVRSRGPEVHFELQGGPGLAVFDGTLDLNAIQGKFVQSGVEGTFKLERFLPSVESDDPVPSPDFQESEVRFGHSEAQLAGTLLLPSSPPPYPAVVFITGSGPQNRDEEMFGFKPFKIIAEHLGRHGIASLRYDDRGYGASKGDLVSATTDDFALDAESGLDFLKTRHEVEPAKIGFLGHSEGAVVAAIVASRRPEVGFAVLLAGNGMKGDQLLFAQSDLLMRANGASDEQLRSQKELQARIFRAIRSGRGWDEVETGIREQTESLLAHLSRQQRDARVRLVLRQQMAFSQSPWMKSFIDMKPTLYLEKVTCPLLALFGELDLQVPARENHDLFAAALQRAGNRDHTLKILPGANHLFQKAKSGSVAEYATLEKQFVDGFLEIVTDWLVSRNR